MTLRRSIGRDHAFLAYPFVVLLCGTMVMMVTFGVRMTYGLWLAPASSDLGWGIETQSFAMAIQALAWGIATPFAGAVADRWGTRPGAPTVGATTLRWPSGDGQCDDPLSRRSSASGC